jgi:hypothetical protein
VLGVAVTQSPGAEDALTVASRSQDRLARALENIGIEVGTGVPRLYADVDALGTPVVIVGPIGADVADRLSMVLEAGSPPQREGDPSCP